VVALLVEIWPDPEDPASAPSRDPASLAEGVNDDAARALGIGRQRQRILYVVTLPGPGGLRGGEAGHE
jgi:hypothetical protein